MLETQLATSRFGEVTVIEGDVIHFPSGIPGFETHQRWVLVGDESSAVLWLQSLSDGALALPVGLAELLHPGYNARIPREQLEELQPVTEDDLATFLVLSIPPDQPWEMTANLRAPLLVNRASKKATQALATNEDYSFNHFILGESSRQAMRERAAASANAE